MKRKFFGILTLAVTLLGVSALVAQAPPATLESAASVARDFPGLGLTVELTKTVDPATGATTVQATTADGRSLDLPTLLAWERQAQPDPERKIHPELRRRLEAAAGGPVEISLWLRFDPRDVDFVEEFRTWRKDGMPEDPARAALRAAVAAGNLKVMQPALQLMAGLGLPVNYADVYAPLIFTVADATQIADLAAEPAVAHISPMLEGKPALASAQGTHRWDRVHDFGVRGDGVTLAVIEPGTIDTAGTGINIVGTHIPSQPLESHATSVASVAGSDDPTYPGYARGVQILNANPANSSLAAWAAAATWAVNQGATVLTQSFNSDVADLTMTSWDFMVDYFVRYLRVTWTISASNAGLGSGSVKSPALAWNCITVGAAEDQGNADWSDDAMAGYSSFNDPISTHGDREKPELCAIGSGLLSMGIGGTPTSVNGTSFSTPTMAGIAACLAQAEPSLGAWPEAMKAVLMAAATHNIEGASRLSDKDGAGCINGLQALRILEQRQLEFGSFSPSILTSPHATSVFLRGGDLTRAVLCWCSDANAAWSSDTLAADLDLAVLAGQGTTTGPTLATSASWDNSYEIVEFCPPSTGWYTFRVSGFAFAGTTEPYALAWTQDTDGRYVRFRPSYPDVTADDHVGPGIGNPNFTLAPYDPVNPGNTYIGIAAGSAAVGLPLPGCRHLPIDPDQVSDISVTPGNAFFLDFMGNLDMFGEAPTMRMSVPDAPFLAGFPLYFAMVTIDPAATGNIKELALVEKVNLWDHAVDLQLGDDDSQAVNLGFSFPFFGGNYSIAYINSNGNITFTSGDTSYTESVTTFLNGGPRIAPFWDDLSPNQGGIVRARFAGDRFVVEWVNVPEYNAGNENSVIVILHQDGKVEFMYRDCALGDALVGITPGDGTTGYPVDLSHGSRFPDPLLYISPPAMYEHFTGGFDLGTSSDVRSTVSFTPTGFATGNYRMTFDRE